MYAMAPKPVSIVVIGASHAGLGVSHRLLRHTSAISVTLVNPSDEYYFNIAAPRFLVKPNSLSPSQYFYSIADSFTVYPPGSFHFVRGLVANIDHNKKSINVATEGTARTHPNVTLSYDYLVIASGSTTPATLGQAGLRLPFKANGFEDTRLVIENASKALRGATNVVIGGGGPLGVELAGELAEVLKPKGRIMLVSRSCSLLDGATEYVSKTAESLLRSKDVEVLKSVTVDGALQDLETTQWTITLSTGQQVSADAYVSTTGTIPNNDFIPESYLNEEGWVNVDAHLRVLDGQTSRPEIYAVGDITCHEYRLLSRIPEQTSTVVSNIMASIRKEGKLAVYAAEAQRKMLVVPVGQSTGTGHLGGWPLFGWLVWYFKGRDFLVYKARKFMTGQAH